MKSAFAAIFMAVSLGATAQTITDESVKAPVVKKQVEPKKKVEAKKPAPKKKEAAKAKPEVRVYTNSANPPILRDKGGNIIPTNPDAYDVSSAIGKKK